MLRDTLNRSFVPLPLLPSVCWRAISSVGRRRCFEFCAAVRKARHFSHTLARRSADRVVSCPPSCGPLAVLCLVSVATAVCRDRRNAAPRCHISRNPPADARPRQEESAAASPTGQRQDERIYGAEDDYKAAYCSLNAIIHSLCQKYAKILPFF